MSLKSINKALGLINLAALLLTFSGCVSVPSSPSQASFVNGDYATAAMLYKQEYSQSLNDKKDRSYSLHALELGQFYFDAGQYEEAYSWFLSATKVSSSYLILILSFSL